MTTYRKLAEQSRPAPQKGFHVGGMSEESWKSLQNTPIAKEFVTFHSQMTTGGFAYFYDRNVKDNGATFHVRKSQDFVLKYAPGHYKLFMGLTDEALDKAKSGGYTELDDEQFDKRYRQFSAAMEKEIEGKWKQ